MRRIRSSNFAFCMFILFQSYVWAQQPERLTIEWSYSEEGKNVASVPSFQWIKDDRVLLYDTRRPKTERTIESFDPVSGIRKSVVDRAAALKTLNELLKPKEPIGELEWAEEIDWSGGWAVYSFQDDLFLLDLQGSRFKRVTSTKEEEKAARFSPDGKKLSFVRSSNLFVYDLAAETEKQLTRDGSETLLNGTLSWVYWEEIFDRRDLGYWWSPDSLSIAYLQTDESGVGEMYFVDFKPYSGKLIRQRYPKAGETNPSVRVGVVLADTARTTWLDLTSYEFEYLARVKWMPDSRKLALQTLDRPQTTLSLLLADSSNGKTQLVLKETDKAWVNINDDLYFLRGRNQFLWVSERDGYAHLYLYDLDGRHAHQITRGKWALCSSGGGVFWLRQSITYVDEEHGWVYFTSLEKSSLEKHLYRMRLDGSARQRLTTEDGDHGITFSPGGRYYLDRYSNVETPPSLSIHRNDGSRLQSITDAAVPFAKRFNLRKPELFAIPAKDAFPMPAQILKPANFNPSQKYPVVLYVYGGPSAPTVVNGWGFQTYYWEHILTDAGFVALRVDNRCATAQSKTLENTILNEGYGTTELADLLDAVKWVKSQSWADPERIGIWGWSGGGSFTLLAMTSSKEFRAGIAVAAISDWRYYDSRWAESFMKQPADNPEGYRKTSNAERAADLHGRLLLVHGTYDDNVHPQNTWRFADELIKAGKMFDMMIYPMRKHGISDDSARIHLYNTMLEFWKRELR